LESTIHDWGYLALFLYSFGGGMLGLAVASVFSFSGDLNIYYVILIAFVANFFGDQFLFTIARNNKEYAKEVMQKHKRKIALSILLMRKYGSMVIFFQKYLYGIKTLIPLAMGLSKYDNKKFMILNIFASIIWSILVGTLAYSMGQIVLDTIKEYKIYGILFLIAFVFTITYFMKKY
jgi:membrane protein DedA with SNARE-associated domain